MAEVLLSDYLAHLLSQVSKARDMADRQSKEIALLYAKDEVLRHFSVPRFKLAKMNLTMPVMVSGVEVTSLMQFLMARGEFNTLILGKVVDLITLVLPIKPGPTAGPVVTRGGVLTDGIEPLSDVFYDQLVAAPDLSRPETVINNNWAGIVEKALTNNKIPSELTKLKPIAEILSRALVALTDTLRGKISIPKATIERLLINPVTNVVKDGSSESSVFTIKAELIEEGVIIKRVRDETTGAESSVVEFE